MPDSPAQIRMRLSADYYDIHLTDQIGSVGVQVIGDLCRQGKQEYCALITFNSQGTVLSVLNTNVNNASFRVRGIDLEAAYSLPLDFISLPGAVNFRAMATRTFEFATTTVGGTEDKVGQIPAGVLPQEPPNMPYWLGNYSATYNLGKFTGGVSFKYVSKGVVESQSIDGTTTERLNNRLPHNVITNFNASYQILDEAGRKLQVYGIINNAFNQGPPFPVFPVTNWAAYYDTLGTQFRAGIRFEY